MTIDVVNDTVCVQYSKRKIVIDGCSHPNVLQLYLHAYREKYGDEALLILADHMELKAQ